MDELSFDLLSASLRQDTQDVATFTEVLAQKLSQAIPNNVEIARRGGLFSRSRAIHTITVTFPEWHYQIIQEKGQWQPKRLKVVRGIALKTEMLLLDEWILGLSKELSRLAAQHEEARLALEKFLL